MAQSLSLVSAANLWQFCTDNQYFHGGNASYAGYVRTKILDDGINYDLAIICYGQNDDPKDFGIYYESLIRAILNKYDHCSIISILESSQKEYTEKIQTIQELASHYKIPLADIIAPFQSDYSAYVSDTVHPNDKGYKIYAETVNKIIDHAVNSSIESGKEEIAPLNHEAVVFDTLRWYKASDFIRIDETTFTLNTNIMGKDGKGTVLGIDYVYQSGENVCKIQIDGEEYAAPSVYFIYDFSQRHILIVSDNCTVNRTIEIKFGTKKQADDFRGIFFSGLNIA